MYRTIVLGEELKKLFIEPNYVRQAWKQYVELLKHNGYRYPRYDTFRLEIYMATKLGLLIRKYKRKPERGNFMRVYYQVVPDKLNAKEWENIVGHYKSKCVSTRKTKKTK